MTRRNSLRISPIKDFSEFLDQHRFLYHRAACFRLYVSPPPSPTTVLRNVAAQLSISTLYQRSSSISQANPSSVRNFIAATFDNVVTIKYK